MHKLYTSNRDVKLEKRDHSLSRVSQKYSHFHHLVAQGLPVHVLPSLAHAGVRRVRLLAVLEAWYQAARQSQSLCQEAWEGVEDLLRSKGRGFC